MKKIEKINIENLGDNQNDILIAEKVNEVIEAVEEDKFSIQREAGKVGGKAAAKKMTAEEKKKRAQAGAEARWGKKNEENQ